ncbi:MAG: hypothetical protein ACRDQ5_24565 [Sciscionella sp.]
MELATVDDISGVTLRAKQEGKGLVFTAHDLEPNIEADRMTFEHKTTLLARRAGAVMSLTGTAVQRLAQRSQIAVSSVYVVPHGAALPLSLLGDSGTDCTGFAVFGALRPNRDFRSVVRAWRHLAPRRPPLRLLVRSLREPDRQRYASTLATLEDNSCDESDLTVTMTPDVMPPDELVSWCRLASVLVLPYPSVTHSGQLELARDLRLRVVAPDVPTLRAQLDAGPECPVVWFRPSDLGDPKRFASHLREALSLPASTIDGHSLHEYRVAEHTRLLDAHHDIYSSVTSNMKV